jgi:protocatechuate 3,4-dioxygenase beta subunit
VANATVSVQGSNKETFSGADGKYVLHGLAPGSYTLSADSEQCWPSTKDNVQTGRTADFQLIEKRYLNRAGLIVADVSAADVSRLLNAAKIAGDTQAQLLLVNRLLADSPTDATLKQQSSALATELEHKSAQIEGTVTDASGVGVPNAHIKVTNEMTGRVVSTDTDDRGKYQVSVYPLGNYRIDTTHGSDADSAKIKSQISPDIRLTHDVQLSSPK